MFVSSSCSPCCVTSISFGNNVISGIPFSRLTDFMSVLPMLTTLARFPRFPLCLRLNTLGRARCQRDPSLLAEIVKPVKGTVHEDLIDDSAHMGKPSPSKQDPEALDPGVAKPEFFGESPTLKSVPYVYTSVPPPLFSLPASGLHCF